MVAFSTFLTILLTGFAAALPEPRNSCQTFTDTFEDVPASTVGVPVGTYHGITYQAFSAFSKSAVTGSNGGVIPHSGSNTASASARSDLQQIGTVAIVPFGNIIASPSKSFNLQSLWLGCGVMGQSTVATAIGCSISLTGFDIWGKQVSTASFNYAPKGTTAAPMDFFTVPSQFTNLQNVTFGIADATAASTISDVQLDDVVHCNNN